MQSTAQLPVVSQPHTFSGQPRSRPAFRTLTTTPPCTPAHVFCYSEALPPAHVLGLNPFLGHGHNPSTQSLSAHSFRSSEVLPCNCGTPACRRTVNCPEEDDLIAAHLAPLAELVPYRQVVTAAVAAVAAPARRRGRPPRVGGARGEGGEQEDKAAAGAQQRQGRQGEGKGAQRRGADVAISVAAGVAVGLPAAPATAAMGRAAAARGGCAHKRQAGMTHGTGP